MSQEKSKQAFSYSEKIKALAPLETFSPEAFVEDEQCPASVCRLILALALVHNDLSDIDFGVTLLKTATPPLPVIKTREWALHNGVGLHLSKLRAALVYELLQLIRENRTAIEHAVFGRLLKKLSARDRDAWNDVVEAAHGHPRSTKLGKFLGHCRDKTVNHYDAKVISSAFEKRFSDGRMQPLISRGNSMYSTRFYFVDAAVEETVTGGEHRDIASEFFFEDNSLVQSINLALFFLVTDFVTMRRPGWRRVVEGGTLAS